MRPIININEVNLTDDEKEDFLLSGGIIVSTILKKDDCPDCVYNPDTCPTLVDCVSHPNADPEFVAEMAEERKRRGLDKLKLHHDSYLII